ncbi:hypothetical protein RJ640_014840 [Escallonia rubra]|uniref:Bifunctional inhibitor/plant lipid transfer protein/seed storage helical domain-containing protein n=1 Tax=Escallonia rubra TaxID=112253 RepID=A0AA88UGW3_9ASTE|nr:hypothetical protein RJ640_014840 [Escallonia rubra]
MGAKLLMTLLLITSSWVSMVVPQWGAETCMSKLLPCKPFFHAPSTVTNACCVPLKKAISDDLHCLCDGLNNNVIMESFNVSRDQALLLPKACGSKADTSVCNHHVAGFTVLRNAQRLQQMITKHGQEDFLPFRVSTISTSE